MAYRVIDRGINAENAIIDFNTKRDTKKFALIYGMRILMENRHFKNYLQSILKAMYGYANNLTITSLNIRRISRLVQL
jgi:hypothetical protein